MEGAISSGKTKLKVIITVGVTIDGGRNHQPDPTSSQTPKGSEMASVTASATKSVTGSAAKSATGPTRTSAAKLTTRSTMTSAAETII